MSNSLLTNSVITKETLMSLKNHLVFAKNVTTEYSEEFAQKGAKKGATVNIRKPSRYEVTEGATLNIQDSQDQSVALTLDKHYHVGMAFSEVDRALSIDKFRERYIEPATIALANKIESQFAIDMYKQVFSSVGVPSASALPSTLKGFTLAKAKMALLGAPKGTYTAVVDPLVEASMVEGLKGLFQSSEQIAKQYEEGVMGMAGGCKFMMSQNIPKHTIGALGGTPLMNGTTLAGATTLVTNGWTAAAATRLKAGDVISIAAVNAVNPQTRQPTGELAQFVVAADTASDASGNMTITIDRAIYASGQYQNVDALPLTGAAITVFGHASSYANIIAPQNLVFHKNAFALATADFELPTEGVSASRAVDKDSGLSLTMTSQFDIVNYRTVHRLDFLGGWKCIYPELASRVVGQPA
ncbi:MAG: P22 phage major capsid protein family protein [Bdellovibrio sp.]